MHRLRFGLIALLALALAACGGGSIPPTPQPDGNLPLRSLEEIGRGDFDGATVSVVAPVIQRAAAQVLVPALSLGAGAPTPLLPAPNASIALGGDPLTGLQPAGDAQYGVARATGIIQVGSDGVRQIQPRSVKVLEPTEVTLGQLRGNSSVYQGQVVKVRGTLISKSDESLMVEEVGAGGVPAANAAQIKVAQPFPDAALLEALPNGNAALRYGELTLVGLWRGTSLTVFWGSIGG